MVCSVKWTRNWYFCIFHFSGSSSGPINKINQIFYQKWGLTGLFYYLSVKRTTFFLLFGPKGDTFASIFFSFFQIHRKRALKAVCFFSQVWHRGLLDAFSKYWKLLKGLKSDIYVSKHGCSMIYKICNFHLMFMKWSLKEKWCT